MRQAVFTAVEGAKARGATISFDPNVRPELFPGQALSEVCRPVLDAADVILPSRAEAEQLTGLADPDEACRALLAGARTVLLKRGAEGCTLYTAGLDTASLTVTSLTVASLVHCTFRVSTFMKLTRPARATVLLPGLR